MIFFIVIVALLKIEGVVLELHGQLVILLELGGQSGWFIPQVIVVNSLVRLVLQQKKIRLSVL